MTIKTAREARAGGAPATLTRGQPGLPAALAGIPVRVFTRYERTADVHVQHLRAKPGGDPKAPRWIVTVTGAGRKPGGRSDD